MDPRLLMRMSQLARNPPSWRRVKLGAAVLAACLILWGVEQLWGWPDWLTVNGKLRP